MSKFNKTKYNIRRLQPAAVDVELNKCNHLLDSESESYDCVLCGININPNLNIDKIKTSASILVEQLETLKIVANGCLNRRELKECQKYFDMIPLLKNIGALYSVCEDSNIINTEDDEYDELDFSTDSAKDSEEKDTDKKKLARGVKNE